MKYSIKEVLSHGYVMGTIKCDNLEKKNRKIKSIDEEKESFLNSIEKSIKELAKIKDDSYIEIQRLMVSDPLLKTNGLEYIEAGKSAEEAINLVMEDIIKSLIDSTSSYLKERTIDIIDIKNRLINNLYNKRKKKNINPFILYTDHLMPSYLINNKDYILGVIAKNGGYTSHSAILCRSFEIPYVLADIECKDEDVCCIDTRKNKIAINPSISDMERYIEEINESNSRIKVAVKHPGFQFLANISMSSEVQKVLEYDFDGIGLFRTELIFMNSNRPLSFEEQYDVYNSVVKAMGTRSVCFRTFDVGDDKKISYLNVNHKGFDNYINNKEIFETQVKAILATNELNNVKIMFPMIETKDEFIYLRDWVIKIANDNNYKIPQIGMMLETKNALENIKDFGDAKFISLGTNDLCSELYHINREKRLDNFNEYIDDLLNKLTNVINFCNKKDIFLSVCGELAGVKEVAIKFLKLGIRNLSVSTSLIQMLNSTYIDFTENN